MIAPEDQYAVLGSDFDIECSTTLTTGPFLIRLAPPDGDGYISDSLTNVSLDDAGMYKCSVLVIVDGEQINVEKAFNLHVVGKRGQL